MFLSDNKNMKKTFFLNISPTRHRQNRLQVTKRKITGITEVDIYWNKTNTVVGHRQNDFVGLFAI